MPALAHRPKRDDSSVIKSHFGGKPVPDITAAVKDVGLDVSSTADTVESITELPAVVHEVVKPSEHQILTEHISREIHYHDVYHRILPVIDLEILPTKHYVIDPGDPGVLREIHEPSVKNSWRIVRDIEPRNHPDTAANRLNNQSPLQYLHRAHNDQLPQPVLTSKTSYMTEEGFMRTDYFWKHPPTLDMTLFESGETSPLRMDCCPEKDSHGFVGGQETRPGRSSQENTKSHKESRTEAEQLRHTARQSMIKHFAVPPNSDRSEAHS